MSNDKCPWCGGIEEHFPEQECRYDDHLDAIQALEERHLALHMTLAADVDMYRERADSATERNKQLLARFHAAESTIRDLTAKVAELYREHCKDCCCARSWEALGNPPNNEGASIPEHIAALRSRVEAIDKLPCPTCGEHDCVSSADCEDGK
jgi:hypothetical protein